MNTDTIMEYLANVPERLGFLTDAMAALTEVSLPVPDIILILLIILVVALMRMSAASERRKAVDAVSDVYVNELSRANRQAHSAEMKLARVKSDLERTRRRNRTRA